MLKLSQRGAIQFIVILILLAGIVGVVYLVTAGPLKIFPKASVSGPVTPTTSFTLSRGPLIKPYIVGEEVAVQILVHSDIAAANLFNAKINFDSQVLQLGRVDVTSPFIKNWVEQYWGDPGKISLVGGVPNPGFQTQPQDTAVMATLYFTALKPGSTTISFDDTSVIYSNADNTNILVSKNPITLELIKQDVTIPEKSIAYNLQAGWNGLGIPLNNPDQSPAQLLEATGGKCTDIQGFNPSSGQATFYTSDPAKAVLNSLTQIVGGQGYLVRCTTPASLTLTGPAYVTAMPQLMVSNNQYISLPKDKTMTAQEFLEAVSNNNLNCTNVYHWVNDGWEGHRTGSPLNNFQMNDKEAYNVKCVSPTTVSPSPSATPQPGTGDGNGDGKVDLTDLSVLLSDFNKTSGFRKGIELNGDGKINSFDFSLMRNLLAEKKVIKG